MKNLNKAICCAIWCFVGANVQAMDEIDIERTQHEQQIIGFMDRVVEAMPSEIQLKKGIAAVKAILKFKPIKEEDLKLILGTFCLRNIDDPRNRIENANIAPAASLQGDHFWLYFQNPKFHAYAGSEGCIRLKQGGVGSLWMHDGGEFISIEGKFGEILRQILRQNEGEHKWPVEQ